MLQSTSKITCSVLISTRSPSMASRLIFKPVSANEILGVLTMPGRHRIDGNRICP